MSRGKYSPRWPHPSNVDHAIFCYNAKKEIPPEYVVGRDVYDQELHFGNYDAEGFDSYGYSAYDAAGKYVGIGQGIDRLGYTEDEYLTDFTDEEFNNL